MRPRFGPQVAVTVDGRRLTDADLEVAPAGEGAWSLTGPDLAVRVVVEAGVGVERTRAEITGRGRLQHVELARWPGLAADGHRTTGEPVPYNVGAVGLGQPVFGPGWFAGVEHPMAENLAGPPGVTLGLPVAADLGPEPFRTPAAVIGTGGREEFDDYVDTLRPNPPRLVVLSNNWYHLGDAGRMDEATVRAEVDGFAAVAASHGLALDFVCLDDPWDGEWQEDTGLWGRMAPSRFPGGLDMGGLGLWLSPAGGYFERRTQRVAWAGAHGLEVDGRAGLLCTAGRRYRASLAGAFRRWTEAGVGYWKVDGVRFDCAEEGHGHPVGPGARTAQADAFVGLVAGIRARRPDAVVAFTIGSHPSPWWLSSVDFVWRGGLDDTTAEAPGTRLDRFDTYLDRCLQAYRPAALPVSALVIFSIVESAAAGYRDEESGPGGWARHCWLAVGRGTLHHDLYVAPDSLTDGEWSVLAEALAWARRRQHVLARSRMVLGDPSKGEVYGFMARRGEEGTVCLRNPSDRPRPVDLDLAGADLTPVFGRLPTGTLDPFEVVVADATWRR